MKPEPIQREFKLAYWNIEGLFNLWDLEKRDLKLLEQCEIICFAETFVLTNEVKIINTLQNNFNIFSSLANRDKTRGRGSGGLMILVSKNLQSSLIETSSILQFVRVKFDYDSYIIGLGYWNRSVDTDFCINSLRESVQSIQETYIDDKIILLGDWNGRIGQLGEVEAELLENTKLKDNRVSKDHKIDRRGRLLVELMDELGLLLLNGRTAKDHPGEFTCLTANGKSCIDLIWVNGKTSESVWDMQFIDVGGLSCHLLCLLKLEQRFFKNTKNTNIFKKGYSAEITKLNCTMEYQLAFQNELSILDSIYFNSRSPDDLYNNFFHSVRHAGLKSGLWFKYTAKMPTRDRPNTKPWFNSTCVGAKKNMRQLLRLCKRFNFEDSLYKEFINAKKMYRNIMKKERKLYEKNIVDKLSNLKNSSEFWKTVKEMKPKKLFNDSTPYEKYSDSLKVYQTSGPTEELFFTSPNSADPFIDKDFKLEELEATMTKIKKNKSPGPDGIHGEIFKILTPEWQHYLLNLFNCVLNCEAVPKDWSVVKMCLLFKNGDANDPANYRGISLINNITKIFTSMISSRLYKIAEEAKLIPEEQSGFRKDRGCIDNVFVLQSAINLQLRKKSGKLICIFVDFRKAFDSLVQTKLWQKLYCLGLSAKLIRIIKSMYDQAEVIFSSNGQFEEKIKINKGVLQGDSLSPLLFILFLADIIEFFEKKEMVGINVGWLKNLLLLLYADDLVMFAHTWKDAQKMLNALSDYCELNSLEVNISKTKVMIFHKGKPPKTKSFFYRGNVIEVVSDYRYLGVQFNSSGLYIRTVKNFISRASAAAAKVTEILRNSKSDSLATKYTLYDSIVNPTLLYCAEIWAPRYMNVLESVQLKYFKSIFRWPRCTPNHYVRLETGRMKVKSEVIRAIVKWWSKTLNMGHDRLPKACIQRYISLDQMAINVTKFNWYSQIKGILAEVQGEHVLKMQSSEAILLELPELMTKINNNSISEDVEATLNSEYNPLYRKISSLGIGEDYMKTRADIKKIRVISQLRIAKNKYCRLVHNGCIYVIDANEKCSICNLNEEESLEHFFFKCPHYKSLRKYWLSKIMHNNLEELFSLDLVENLNSIYRYTTEAIKIRAFLRND